MSIKLKRLLLICFSIIIALSSFGCASKNSEKPSNTSLRESQKIAKEDASTTNIF